ncbi:hypothetical protein N665_0068s0009 [Sinapis alba]|nr:hypothetical protein N665_0068s0009 [Sinapis alba]
MSLIMVPPCLLKVKLQCLIFITTTKFGLFPQKKHLIVKMKDLVLSILMSLILELFRYYRSFPQKRWWGRSRKRKRRVMSSL